MLNELFISEGKRQVLGLLCNGMKVSSKLSSSKVIVYDDACHLVRLARNTLPVDHPLLSMEYVIDRMHFRNLVDPWCKENCDPEKCPILINVSTKNVQNVPYTSLFSCL